MAHEIDMSNGRANFCFTGSRNKIWHQLGTEMSDDSSIDEWKIQAGLDWEVREADILYSVDSEDLVFPSRKALFRSDTKAPLSIVGDGFKVVQPTQIIDFFSDLCENNGMKLSTAGALFGGKRFFALAEMDKKDQVVAGDDIVGNLLLTTAVDGSLATTAKFVSERVVCNNTLTIALNEKSKNLVKVVHSADWDATQVKIDLGLIDASWAKFISDMRKLANTKISHTDARKYVQSKFYTEGLSAEDQRNATLKKVDDIMLLMSRGAGADLAKGTAWGVVNAFTNYYTHGNGRKRDASKKFWSAYYDSDKIKQEVVDDMMELV